VHAEPRQRCAAPAKSSTRKDSDDDDPDLWILRYPDYRHHALDARWLRRRPRLYTLRLYQHGPRLYAHWLWIRRGLRPVGRPDGDPWLPRRPHALRLDSFGLDQSRHALKRSRSNMAAIDELDADAVEHRGHAVGRHALDIDALEWHSMDDSDEYAALDHAVEWDPVDEHALDKYALDEHAVDEPVGRYALELDAMEHHARELLACQRLDDAREWPVDRHSGQRVCKRDDPGDRGWD
jgi:hypothetical protein